MVERSDGPRIPSVRGGLGSTADGGIVRPGIAESTQAGGLPSVVLPSEKLVIPRAATESGSQGDNPANETSASRGRGNQPRGSELRIKQYRASLLRPKIEARERNWTKLTTEQQQEAIVSARDTAELEDAERTQQKANAAEEAEKLSRRSLKGAETRRRKSAGEKDKKLSDAQLRRRQRERDELKEELPRETDVERARNAQNEPPSI